jgi:hypothetical protein
LAEIIYGKKGNMVKIVEISVFLRKCKSNLLLGSFQKVLGDSPAIFRHFQTTSGNVQIALGESLHLWGAPQPIGDISRGAGKCLKCFWKLPNPSGEFPRSNLSFPSAFFPFPKSSGECPSRSGDFPRGNFPFPEGLWKTPGGI